MARGDVLPSVLQMALQGEGEGTVSIRTAN